VASDGAKLQALIRRQFADLEDAVRARREWLLAAARREEAQALLRLQQRRSAPGLVTAGQVAALDAHPSALRGLTVDTSRVLSGIDNLALRPAAQHQQQNQRVAPSSSLALGQPHIDGYTDQGTAPRVDALATAARKRPVEAEVAAPLSLPSPRNAPSAEPPQQAAVSNRAPTLNRPSVAGRGGGAAVRPATSGGGPSSPLDPAVVPTRSCAARHALARTAQVGRGTRVGCTRTPKRGRTAPCRLARAGSVTVRSLSYVDSFFCGWHRADHGLKHRVRRTSRPREGTHYRGGSDLIWRRSRATDEKRF
jgi:hypothetical protein